jgi:hypothetical protein
VLNFEPPNLMAISSPRAPEETFAEVKLAPHANSGSHFFLEHASTWSLLISLAMLATFLVMHAYGALRAPPILADKEEYYALNSTEGNVSIDVDVTLSQLVPGHRFIAVNASLVPKDASKAFALPVDVTVRTTYMRNFNVTGTDTGDQKSKADLVYVAGDNHTNFFPVVQASVLEADTLQIRTSVETDFTGIAGFLFHWDFANPSAEKYDRSSKLLMSFLVGYMLVVFALYLRFDAESFTQIFLLVIGVTGVFASNPLTYFFPQAPGAHISNHIFMAVFEAVFRLFLIAQLELLRTHSTAPPTIFLVVLGVFFAFFATVQAAATYDREAHVVQAQKDVALVFQTEYALIVLDVLFTLGSIAYLIVAAISNEGVNPRRVALVGVSLVGIILSLLISEVYFVLTNTKLYTTVPSLLVSSTHVTFAAIALFLLHSGGGRQYDAIAEQAKPDASHMDIERRSDDDDSDGDEEEDDDDTHK